MIRAKISDFTRKLHGLSFSYNRCFEKNSPHTKAVLKDLAKFCRANETAFHKDPRIHALIEGRREVFYKISNHLNLTIEELYDLLKIREIKPEEETNE